MKNQELQPNLYGPEDKVFNVLETDVTMIKSDIKVRHDKIDKLKSEIKKLGERLIQVEEARDIVAENRKRIEVKVETEVINGIQNGKTG